jgi:hypothetical protein
MLSVARPISEATYSLLSWVFPPTERPRYWPQEGHTRCGTMGAEQLGHGIRFGASTLSCWARRMSRLLLVFRRLGTATGSLLGLLQSAGNVSQRRKPSVEGPACRRRRG